MLSVFFSVIPVSFLCGVPLLSEIGTAKLSAQLVTYMKLGRHGDGRAAMAIEGERITTEDTELTEKSPAERSRWACR